MMLEIENRAKQCQKKDANNKVMLEINNGEKPEQIYLK